MGADFMYVVIPGAIKTDGREKELRKAIMEYILGLGNEYEDGQTLFLYSEEYWQLLNRRDTDIIHLVGSLTYILTGGLSWGCSPTASFDIISALASIQVVWDLLMKWSTEDYEGRV